MDQRETRFVPCRGKEFCTDDEGRCRGCGRTLDEIARARDLVDGLAELAIEMNYSNVDEYVAYVAKKVQKKVKYRREQAALEQQ